MKRRDLVGVGVAVTIVAVAVAGHGLAVARRRALPVLRVTPRAAAGKDSATIGVAGGALRVKTPNRTSVKLVVPAGALAADTRVTLTPLAAVKRIPFRRGIAGAVQLRPEGLVLAKPAKLLIHPRKRLSPKSQTAFSATGQGRSFHVYPGKPGRTMSVPIVHFSVYGEGEASRDERKREARRRQGTMLAQVERDLASNGSDAKLARSFESLAREVAPEVTAALSEDSMVSKALGDALSLAEALRLAGWSSAVLPPNMGDRIPRSAGKKLRSLIAQITASFPTAILNNALQRALNRCEAEHTQKSRDGVLSVLEMMRLFGLSDGIDMSLLERCYGYELRYTHTSVGSVGYAYDHSSGSIVNFGKYGESRNVRVSATVPLKRAADGSFSGAAPLLWESASWTSDDDNTGTNQAASTCEIEFQEALVGGIPGTLTVSSLKLADQSAADVTIAGLKGNWHTAEIGKSGACPVFDGDHQRSYLMTEIAAAHGARHDTVGWLADHSGFRLRFDGGWVPGSGDVIATRTLGGTAYDLGPGSDETMPFTDVFQIVHVSG